MTGEIERLKEDLHRARSGSAVGGQRRLQILNKGLQALPIFHGGPVGELDAHAVRIASSNYAPDVRADIACLEQHLDSAVWRHRPGCLKVTTAQTNISELC